MFGGLGVAPSVEAVQGSGFIQGSGSTVSPGVLQGP